MVTDLYKKAYKKAISVHMRVHGTVRKSSSCISCILNIFDYLTSLVALGDGPHIKYVLWPQLSMYVLQRERQTETERKAAAALLLGVFACITREDCLSIRCDMRLFRPWRAEYARCGWKPSSKGREWTCLVVLPLG